MNVLAFKNESQAFQVRDALVKLEHESLCEIIDTVVETCDAASKVKLDQSVGEPLRSLRQVSHRRIWSLRVQSEQLSQRVTLQLVLGGSFETMPPHQRRCH